MGLFYKTIEEFAEKCKKLNANDIEVTLYHDISLAPFDNGFCSILSGDIICSILASYKIKGTRIKSKEILEKFELSLFKEERNSEDVFAERIEYLKNNLIPRLENTRLNYSFKD